MGFLNSGMLGRGKMVGKHCSLASDADGSPDITLPPLEHFQGQEAHYLGGLDCSSC